MSATKVEAGPEPLQTSARLTSSLRSKPQRYNFDLARAVVMGHSAGGQLALCLAAHEASVSRVVSLAGVLDLRRAHELRLSNDAVAEFLHGTPNDVPDHYREADPMELSVVHAKQWIIQGSADDIVPPAFSRDYTSAKGKRTGREGEDVHLLEIEGAGHFDLIDPASAAWQTDRKNSPTTGHLNSDRIIDTISSAS